MSASRRRPGASAWATRKQLDAGENPDEPSAIVRAGGGNFGVAPLTGQSLTKAVLIAAALSGALLLEGCGRRGLPEPLDPAVEKRAEEAPADAAQPSPTANTPQKLPRGIDDNALKAGARKTPTPFDFLL